MFQIKTVQNLISYKKVSGPICLSLPGVGLGGWKDCHIYYNVLKWESSFTLDLNTAKNTDYIKKSFK